MKLFKYMSAGMLTLSVLFSFSATAAPKKMTPQALGSSAAISITPSIFWNKGLTIVACLKDTSGVTTCGKNEMPKYVGNVSKVLQGNFLSIPGASWIAVADKKVSLCGFDSYSTKIECRNIKVPKSINEFEINHVNGSLFFVTKKHDSDNDGVEASAIAQIFVSSLYKAAVSLQAKISDHSPAVGRTGLNSDSSDIVALAGYCDGSYDDISWDCFDSGYDDGFGTKCIPGPITVCVTQPPPPQTVPEIPTSDGGFSMCAWFTAFCTPVEVPPPPAPIPKTPAEIEVDINICVNRYELKYDNCVATYTNSSNYELCLRQAGEFLDGCMKTARGE